MMAINGFISHTAFTCAKSIIFQSSRKCTYYEGRSLVCHVKEKLPRRYSVCVFHSWKNHVGMFLPIQYREVVFSYRVSIHLPSTVFFALKGYFWPWIWGSNLGLLRNNLWNVVIFKFLSEIQWWVRIGTGTWSCSNIMGTRRPDGSLSSLNQGSFLLFKLTRKLSLCRDCFGISKREKCWPSDELCWQYPFIFIWSLIFEKWSLL